CTSPKSLSTAKATLCPAYWTTTMLSLRLLLPLELKTLGKVYKDVEGIAGATILGDGTVAMILDVPGIIKAVQNSAVRA
ncbi:chemotaxis protein CheW, partial [Candidatus Magnetobacterium casense]